MGSRWLGGGAGSGEGVGSIHQQPEVNYLPRFSPQLISLERYTMSVYRAGEIDLFENLDIVHIRLLEYGRMAGFPQSSPRTALRGGMQKSLLQDFSGHPGVSRQKLTNTRQQLQERVRDTPTKGLLWIG